MSKPYKFIKAFIIYFIIFFIIITIITKLDWKGNFVSYSNVISWNKVYDNLSNIIFKIGTSFLFGVITKVRTKKGILEAI